MHTHTHPAQILKVLTRTVPNVLLMIMCSCEYCSIHKKEATTTQNIFFKLQQTDKGLSHPRQPKRTNNGGQTESIRGSRAWWETPWCHGDASLPSASPGTPAHQTDHVFCPHFTTHPLRPQHWPSPWDFSTVFSALVYTSAEPRTCVQSFAEPRTCVHSSAEPRGTCVQCFTEPRTCVCSFAEPRTCVKLFTECRTCV